MIWLADDITPIRLVVVDTDVDMVGCRWDWCWQVLLLIMLTLLSVIDTFYIVDRGWYWYCWYLDGDDIATVDMVGWCRYWYCRYSWLVLMLALLIWLAGAYINTVEMFGWRRFWYCCWSWLVLILILLIGFARADADMIGWCWYCWNQEEQYSKRSTFAILTGFPCCHFPHSVNYCQCMGNFMPIYSTATDAKVQVQVSAGPRCFRALVCAIFWSSSSGVFSGRNKRPMCSTRPAYDCALATWVKAFLLETVRGAVKTLSINLKLWTLLLLLLSFVRIITWILATW